VVSAPEQMRRQSARVYIVALAVNRLDVLADYIPAPAQADGFAIVPVAP